MFLSWIATLHFLARRGCNMPRRPRKTTMFTASTHPGFLSGR